MHKKLLCSLSAVLLTGSLIAGASFAEFSSQATSNNTFTAGTLELELTANDFATATTAWKSPTNWAPGDTVTGQINLKNIGSIDAKRVEFSFTDVTSEGNRAFGNADANILNQIVVKDIHEVFNGIETENQLEAIKPIMDINLDGYVNIEELASIQIYSFDNISGDDTILGANVTASDYSLSLTFQFKPDANSDYQGATGGFTLNSKAIQNSLNSPTEGYISLHSASAEAK